MKINLFFILINAYTIINLLSTIVIELLNMLHGCHQSHLYNFLLHIQAFLKHTNKCQLQSILKCQIVKWLLELKIYLIFDLLVNIMIERRLKRD